MLKHCYIYACTLFNSVNVLKILPSLVDQGWEFVFSLFCSFALVALLERATAANRSCRSLLKKLRERLPCVALYKKNDESDSLLALFTTERRAKERRAKDRRSDSLFLRVGVEEKTSNSLFSPWFSPFYVQNNSANRSPRSIKKMREMDSLMSLFRSQKTSDSQ